MPSTTSARHWRHGTTYSYKKIKCQCDVCLEFGRSYGRRAQKKYRELGPVGDFTHGVSGYTNHSCRCDVCTAAWADAHYANTTSRASREVPVDIHGKESTYSNWRCRCELCLRAHRDYARDLRARRSMNSGSTGQESSIAQSPTDVPKEVQNG